MDPAVAAAGIRQGQFFIKSSNKDPINWIGVYISPKYSYILVAQNTKNSLATSIVLNNREDMIN
jgi:hypothetical protein